MEQDAGGSESVLKTLDDSDERPRSAVNSVVLDYYKKFGRKRDLEQYFSLSTAQSDIRDPRSLFWRRMKEQSDISDSGDKKSEESSNEICRISIKCSIPERSEIERFNAQSNNDSESPPIITDVIAPSPSGDESVDDNHSQKSADGTLDTSINKPLSPTSSVTSQRKLEWDSLADVGYGNESDRKTSASSLSTLEREVLAQKQQYTLDYKQSSDLGLPTAHSTPVDVDSKSKGKKGQGKKTISISRKDVDLVEVSVPQNIENAQPINVNLTKQFSVNLQRDGGMTIDNVKKDISINPEKNLADAETKMTIKMDKEMQTSLLRPERKEVSSADVLPEASTSGHKIPILISLNTIRRKQRRKKIRKSRTKLKYKKKLISKKEPVQDKDKSGEQVSEAESFEYMPGHIYNQNKLKCDPNRSGNNNTNNVGNKSSLESSAVHTTDSSKESRYSFNKDLDKTLNVLKLTLKEKYDNRLKNKLVGEIINRLLKSNYGEGERTPDFLSVLSLASKKSLTTSTSEAENTGEKVAPSKPKKSILRKNKFDASNVASTSQSAPNLPTVMNSDKPTMPYLPKAVSSTTTETELSNNSVKDNTSSDTVFAKTSSEELYKKYIYALKREEAYKQQLKDKELFLKQKLVRSETALKVPSQLDVKLNTKLKELMKDLTRNNYDDGSGDASKLEGGLNSNFDINRQRGPRKQRSHSVFTLSSANSDAQNRPTCLRNKLPKEITPRAGPSSARNEATNRPVVADSSVQVNINIQEKTSNSADEYLCTCTEKISKCPIHEKVSKHPIQAPIPSQYVCLCTEKTPKCPIPSTINYYRSCHHSEHTSLEDDINTNTRQRSVTECTRCQQTKISIHPKLSDPSVSDINIIKSADCVKLINELYKKVSQTKMEGPSSNEKEDSNSNTCKSSKDYIRRNRDDQDNLIGDGAPMDQMIEQETHQTCIGCQKTFINQPESISDNIVIPIQGTNMMLKVSVGGKSIEVQDQNRIKNLEQAAPKGTCVKRNMINREMVTDQIKTNIKGTSVLDECSKFVQVDTQDHYKTTVPLSNEGQGNSRKSSLGGPSLQKQKQTREFEQQSGRYTYPKTVQISDKKPFFRSNTDTFNLGVSPTFQTDAIYNYNEKTPHSVNTETKQDNRIDNTPKPMDNYESKSLKKSLTVSESSNNSENRFRCFYAPQKQYSDESQKSIDRRGYDEVAIMEDNPNEPISNAKNRLQYYNATQKESSDESLKSKEEKRGYSEVAIDEENSNDLILQAIRDITKRYTKEVSDKRSKKKCFKEIMSALSYLLDTDDSGDGDHEVSKKIKKDASDRNRDNMPMSKSCNKSLKSQGQTSYNKTCKCGCGLSECKDCIPTSSETTSSGQKSCTADKQIKSDEKACECDCGLPGCKDCVPTSTEGSKGASSGQKSCTADKKIRSDEKACECGCGLPGCKDCVPTSTEGSKGASSGQKSCTADKKIRSDEKACECGCGFPGCKHCIPTSSAESNTCTSSSLEKQQVKSCEKDCECDACRESSRIKEPVRTSEKACSTSPRLPKPKTGSCGRQSPTSKNCIGTETEKNAAGTFSKKSTRNEYQPRSYSPKQGVTCGGAVDSSKYKSGPCGKETVSMIHTSRSNSPTKTRAANDKGCGTREKESPRLKEHIPRCFLPKKTTCDRACDCDFALQSDENISAGSNSSKCSGTRGQESPRPKEQEVRSCSPKNTKTTRGKHCHSNGKGDGGRCNEPDKPKIQRSREKSPVKTKTTCDRGCGCDGSSDCGECSEPHSSKFCKISEECMMSKSPCKTKKTSDKCCGTDCSKVNTCNHKNTNDDRRRKDYGCKMPDASTTSKKILNRCVKRVKSLYSHCDDSSDIHESTDPACCSTESPASKFVSKIKKECDKYQKHCKEHCKKCDVSSSTADICECRRHHCRRHRSGCKRAASTDKVKRRCVAYNLIVQTSDSAISEDTVFTRYRPLQNVVVRVPKCKQANAPFQEVCSKIEKKMPQNGICDPKGRSQSWPNECGISSTDDFKMAKQSTVREYLERNRPDFVDRCATRQNCIKMISETGARERSQLREQMVGLGTVPSLTDEELMYLAKELGIGRRKPLQQKFMSEREMKKHSEKIYKSLPEVKQKKENAKKESIKKTNLLMANIFKKNLQKKALRGNVNISNYSQVVKI